MDAAYIRSLRPQLDAEVLAVLTAGAGPMTYYQIAAELPEEVARPFIEYGGSGGEGSSLGHPLTLVQQIQHSVRRLRTSHRLVSRLLAHGVVDIHGFMARPCGIPPYPAVQIL